MSDNDEVPPVTELEWFLMKQGYIALRMIPGREWCGVGKRLYTWILAYGLDEDGLQGLYHYESLQGALQDLIEWDGVGDPAGSWIKHKGRNGEYPNPNAGQGEQ